MEDSAKFLERTENDIIRWMDESNNLKNFYFAMILGTIFGIFGSFVSTLLIEIVLKDINRNMLITILLLSILIFLTSFGIFLFYIHKGRKENKVMQGLVNKISKTINDSLTPK